MGVSYWQLGNQTHALDLTQTGVGLVEAAVENGVLAKTTLAVPYGNLATMYQQMGEETQRRQVRRPGQIGCGDRKRSSRRGRSSRNTLAAVRAARVGHDNRATRATVARSAHETERATQLFANASSSASPLDSSARSDLRGASMSRY